MNSRISIVEGIVTFRCYTYDSLNIMQLEVVTNIMTDKAKNAEIQDYIGNDGCLMYADGRWITGCKKTSRILMMQGAVESDESHIFPIYETSAEVKTKIENNPVSEETLFQSHFENELQGGLLP